MRTRMSIAVALVVGATFCAATISSKSNAQIGGFGGGGPRPAAGDSNNLTMCNSIMVAVAKANNAAWGFSMQHGKWKKVAVENPQGRVIAPIISNSVACFVADRKLYAFGEQAGVWDVVDLGVASAPGSEPIVSNSLVVFRSGTKAYAFGAATGKWDVVDLGGPAEISVANHWAIVTVGHKIHVFSDKGGKWDTIDTSLR